MARGKDFGAAMTLATEKRGRKTVTEQAIERLTPKAAARETVPEPAGAAEPKSAAPKDGRKTGRINLRVSADMLANIETMAHLNHTTVTGYLINLVKKDMEADATAASVFRDITAFR